VRAAWGVAGIVLLCAQPARGTECTTSIVGGAPTLQRLDAEVRLRFIRERLQAEARRARTWSYAWGATYAALMIGQLVPLPFVSPETRLDLYVGTAGAALGLIPVVVMPLRVMRDDRWLARRLDRAPAGTHPCVLLAEAESLLVRDAANEAWGRSWLFHTGNVVVNAGIFFIIGAGFGHWVSAVVSGLSGVAVGELMIFTQPTGAVRDLRRYRDGDLGSPAERRLTLAPLVGRRIVGALVVAVF